MMCTPRIAVAALVAALAAPIVITAQDLHPSRRPSPMGMARVTLGDAYVRVVYSRPYKRERSGSARTFSAPRRAARSCRTASVGARAQTRPPRSP
jgi:hypothetical protein